MALTGATRSLSVWIDLANSPHPLLFAPIARALESEGHAVLVTARDHAQTVELARPRWPNLEVIGGPSPPGRVRKARAIARRVGALRSWARGNRPDVALSHNSYAQIAAVRAAGIPAVTAMDYEHQPANHLAFRLARLVVLPEALPAEVARRQGARESKVRRYPGLKEAVYVGDFQPDRGVAERLGVERGPGRPLVVMRTPPSGALYHGFENPLFVEVLETLARQTQLQCVVLARGEAERATLRGLGLPNFVIPGAAIDSRSLVYTADLVIGAGGTMTREAALMGVPTLSLFAGREPAVDRSLERSGRLTRVTDARLVAEVAPRTSKPVPIPELRRLGEPALGVFLAAVGEAAGR
jgi:predicted glycosyltransferase